MAIGGGLLRFHTNFRMVFPISAKNDIKILMEIALNLLIILGTVDILTTLSFSSHDHETSFQVFVSVISLNNVLQLAINRSYACLVKFSP